MAEITSFSNVQKVGIIGYGTYMRSDTYDGIGGVKLRVHRHVGV